MTVSEIAFTFSPRLAPQPTDSWEAAGFALSVHLGKILDSPAPPAPLSDRAGAGPQECPCFRVQSWFYPYSPAPGEPGVFSGDWFGTHRSDDGALWVAVADVTGHGFEASLLASGFPDLWAFLWESDPRPCDGPLDAICWLDGRLAECLPDGVFVEASVVRFTTTGDVALAAAQNRAIVRQRTAAETWGTTRTDAPALWLGLGLYAARPDCLLTVKLAIDDEVLLGTDGLFDMLGDEGVGDLLARAAARPLSIVLADLIPVALGSRERRDDLTAVVTRLLGS